MDDIDDIGVEEFSMDDLEKDLKKGRGGRRWLWLLIGLGIGIGGTVLAPHYLAPYLPESLRGAREILSGPVLSEERRAERVLLTIAAEPGALIASFTERVDEIALLVDPGDIVTIAVPDYEPFVENPDFEGVKKGSGIEPEAADADSSAEENPAPDEPAQDVAGSDSSDAAADDAVEETAAAGATPDTTASRPAPMR